MSNSYDKDSLEVMAFAEEAYVRGSNRLEEIKNYAQRAGIKRIGIAHCVSMPKEASAVGKFLSDNFEVYSIDCKCGRILKKDLLGGDATSVMCNPLGQAEYLKENKTELNISMGLCVGHDMIFTQKSNVAVTTLVVKERVSNHNTMESIRSQINTI
ncbi:MAG: DUF1847 domain-containing protein [Prolixibacteraceae bacterium]